MAENKTYADILREEFIEKILKPQETEDLARELNLLESVSTDYKGRVLLEFIQNMDDQRDKGEIEGLIKLQGNNLIICNQGKPFSKEGIKSVYASHLSSKNKDEGTIGNKGLGFRSVLNFADEVQIFSGEFAIKFSEKEASAVFNENKDNEQIKKSIEKRGSQETYIPMFSVPMNTEFPKEKNKNGKYNIDGVEYDTCIKIHLKNDKLIDEIKTQIHNFIDEDSICLFFLHSLKSLTLIDNDTKIVCRVQKSEDISTDPHIEKWQLIKTNNMVKSANYYICSKDDNLKICIPEKMDADNQYKLFSFFPMNNQDCDFPIVLHADNFDITSNRNALSDKSEKNGEIIKDLMDFMLETAVFFAKPEYGTMAIDMLVHKELRDPFEEYKNDFYDKLCECAVMPTTKGVYKSLNDGLKILPENFNDSRDVFGDTENIVSTEVFEKIPEELQNKIREFTAPELFDEINRVSDKFDSDVRAILFYDWKDFTKYKFPNLMPKILKDSNGEFLTYNDDSAQHKKLSLVATDMAIIDIPSWAKNPVADTKDKDALYKHIEKLGNYVQSEPKNRQISRTYPNDFLYGDITDILPMIDSLINDDYDRALDFVVFLLKNIQNSEQWNNAKKVFKFPCADKSVAPADMLYFGESYNQHNGKLCALFGLTEFVPLDELKLRLNLNMTDEQIINLLSKVYFVNKVPKREYEGKIESKDIYKPYESKICADLNARYIQSLKTTCIGNLLVALESVEDEKDTEAILEWLNQESIKSHIKNNYPVEVWYNGRFQSETLTDNYDRFLLYQKKWLVIGNQKYAPYELILKDIVPEIKSVPSEWEQYKDLFKVIGMKTNVWETEADVFYDILFRLPDFDKDGVVSRQIYANIVNNYAGYDSVICMEKLNFKTKGKLFAKNTNHSKGEFRNVCEVKFASGKTLNSAKEWLLDKPLRKGDAEEFQKIFGVETFKETINITESTPHPRQPEFEKMWDEFKPFAKIYASTNQKIEDILPKLKITIISAAENDGAALSDMENYFVIQGQKKSQWYIWLSKSNELDREMLSSSIGEIFNVIADSKDEVKTEVELLFSKKSEEMRLRVLEETLRCDVTEYKNPLMTKEAFEKALKEALTDTGLPNMSGMDLVDFRNINSMQSVEQIITILKNNRITFKDIKAHGFAQDINFKAYHNNILQGKLAEQKKAYEQKLYADLLQEGPQEQQKFFDCLDDFENQQVSEDDVDCAYEKYCPLIKENANPSVDIIKLFHDNWETFKEKYNISDEKKEELNSIEKSLLLYGQFDEARQRIINQSSSNEKLNEVSEQQEKMMMCEVDVEDSDVEGVVPNNNTGFKKKGGGGSGKRIGQLKVIKGENAECAAYNRLVSDERFTDVEWVSSTGYAKGKGLKNDDSLGYDMTYMFEGKKYLAEVKSVSKSGDKYEFVVSDNERDVALKNLGSYVFILVLPDGNLKMIQNEEKIKEIFSRASAETYKCAVTL